MTTTAALLAAWFQGRLPDGWFAEPVEVRADRDEILVVGVIPATAVAQAARIATFRDQTRDQRVAVAREAEHRFERKVAWAVRCGDREEAFTTASVPVMTRLRMPERRVLDTLIDAGIARSRSEALAWCVRLVGRNQAEWIDQLREAMAHVEKVRAEGPSA
jgi:hypothetical protein